MKTIEIGDDCKYVIIVEDKDSILQDSDLHGISEVLRMWWESDQKFVILAEWGNLKIKFQRAEKV